jgi:hypothetical protein
VMSSAPSTSPDATTAGPASQLADALDITSVAEGTGAAVLAAAAGDAAGVADPDAGVADPDEVLPPGSFFGHPPETATTERPARTRAARRRIMPRETPSYTDLISRQTSRCDAVPRMIGGSGDG